MPVTTSNKLTTPISTSIEITQKPWLRSSDPLSIRQPSSPIYTTMAQRRETDEWSRFRQIVINVPSLRRGAEPPLLYSIASIRITRSRPTHPFSRPRFNNRRVSQLKLTLPSLVDVLPALGCGNRSPGPSAPETLARSNVDPWKRMGRKEPRVGGGRHARATVLTNVGGGKEPSPPTFLSRSLWSFARGCSIKFTVAEFSLVIIWWRGGGGWK